MVQTPAGQRYDFARNPSKVRMSDSSSCSMFPEYPVDKPEADNHRKDAPIILVPEGSPELLPGREALPGCNRHNDFEFSEDKHLPVGQERSDSGIETVHPLDAGQLRLAFDCF